MINKYFKTKKYLNAFIFKMFDTAEPLSVLNSKLTIYPSLPETIPIYVSCYGTIITSLLLLLKVSKFRQKLYSYVYLISRQHGIKRSEVFKTGAQGSLHISITYLLCKREQLLIYSETNFVISSIWIVIAHRLVGIT